MAEIRQGWTCLAVPPCGPRQTSLMSDFPIPSTAALENFGIPDARAVCTAVEGDLAAVIVLAPAYEPPVTRLYRLARGQAGWRVIGMGPLGVGWGATSPVGERGVISFGVETSPD